MLVYHPMYDAYHCALRIAHLACDSVLAQMQWEQVRLLDFYVTFPHLLSQVRLLQQDVGVRRKLRQVPQPYEELPNPSRLFFQLNPIQERAVRLLAAGGVLDRGRLASGFVVVSGQELPKEVAKLGESLSYRAQSWYEFLTSQLVKYPVNGPDGLKARSGLMEFRHDPT